MTTPSTGVQNFQVPVVGLDGGAAGSPSADLVERLTTICHEVGFLVVVDHGVPAAVVDDVFDMMDRFFALPDETKSLIDKRRSPQLRGWEAVGSESTNNRVDHRQQIDVWTEHPVHAAEGPRWLRLLGPNQWMPEDVLPGHREITTAWFEHLGALADHLLAMLSTGLGIPTDTLAQWFDDTAMSLAKFIDYPPTPIGEAGVNAHHDTGFLTVLAAGTTPGLQVQAPDGAWVDVPLVEGSFVINLGEMLQAMTGNYLVATKHRVIAPTARRSAAYFHGPSLATPLDPLPLASRFHDAVAASPRHAGARYMASRDQLAAGVGDMQGDRRSSTYGEQLWNYFERSYPVEMAMHHG